VDPGAPLGAGGSLSEDELGSRRRFTVASGFIVGDSASRQFQVFQGDTSAFWAVCISARDVHPVYERCQQRGVPCTSIQLADWNSNDDIRFFFCVVAGVMFEVMQVEPKQRAGGIL
jgi:hypothetical protein